MTDFIFALLVGLGAGGLYAMLGSGLVAGFKGSGVINFAHGAWAMYAAYTYSELVRFGDIRLPWWDFIPTKAVDLPVRISVASDGIGQVPAVALALVVAIVLGLLSHLLVFRPLRNAPVLAKVIGGLGLMLYIQAAAQINFGTLQRSEEGFLPTGSWSNFLGLGGSIGQDRVWIAIAAVIMGAVLTVFYRSTRVGVATRAADENEKGAILLGYSPQFLAGLNWVIAALTAGIAGLLFVGLAPITPVNYTLFIIPALGAALLGNLSSVALATAGGLGLGAAQSAMVHMSAMDWWPDLLPSAGVRAFVPFLVVIGVLYFRGHRLPIRGSVIVRRLARSPMPRHPFRAAVIPAGVVVVLTLTFSASWQVALVTTLISTIIMLSLVVLVGYLGQISLAQLSLAGVAGYAAARFASNGTPTFEGSFVIVNGPGLPDPLAFLLGVLVAVAVGVLIGIPALRIRGIQLAVVTITAVLTIQELILKNESLMGPAARANFPVPRPNWFGIDVGVQDKQTFLTDRWQFTVFVLFWVVVCAVAVANLRRGRLGRRFLAIRANERAAAAVGIDVARTKLLGFAIASAIAGVGGVLFGYHRTILQAEGFSLFLGIGLFAFLYLGGITSVAGAVVGGFLASGGLMVQIIGDLSESISRDQIAAVGALGLILTAILNPHGISMTVQTMWSEVLKPRLFGRREAHGFAAVGPSEAPSSEAPAVSPPQSGLPTPPPGEEPPP